MIMPQLSVPPRKFRKQHGGGLRWVGLLSGLALVALALKLAPEGLRYLRIKRM